MIREEITKSLKKLFTGQNFTVLIPAQKNWGDFAIHSKQLNGNADQILTKIRTLNLFIKIEEISGFINLWVNDKVLLSYLNRIYRSKKVINIDKNNDKKIIIEYSSPNIAKPFTVGHLRSTVIGDAIANLYEEIGYKVYRDNHIGDWGTQFGKQIYAIKTWGNESAIEKSDKPVKLLVDLYVLFHKEAKKDPKIEDKAREWFLKLESGDDEARRLWKKCIEWSWKEFKKIYQALDVKFTENGGQGFSESYFENKMTPIIHELTEKNLLKENEGAKLVYFNNDALPPLMIVKNDGSTLYSTRDLATDRFRLNKYGNDVVIVNEVGAEQTLYFKQLYKIEDMLGWVTPEQRVHVRHGLYRFATSKMSTREGNVIWLEDVISEAINRAKKISDNNDKISVAIAIGAIKWNDLKKTPTQDVVFDWDLILNMKGNSGPYIQYTYARTQSLIEKFNSNVVEVEHDQKLTHEERELIMMISYFEEKVESSAREFDPSKLCNYLYDLAKDFNYFYEKYPILKNNYALTNLRIKLTISIGNILKKGLNLLGIEAINKI